MKRKNPAAEEYARYRHEGSPEDVVDELGAALGDVLDRVATAARVRAEAASGTPDAAILSRAAAAAQGQADRVRGLRAMIQAAGDPAQATAALNTVANVAAETQFAAMARAAGGPPGIMATTVPAEREWSFDWDFFLEQLPNLAEKMGSLADAADNPILSLISAAIWDVTLIGNIFTHDPNEVEKVGLVDGALDPVLDGVRRLQDELDRLRKGLGEIQQGIDELTELGRRTHEEAEAIEYKADLLGELLGKTLVGQPWHVNPRVTTTQHNVTPDQSLKQEMHGVEDLLGELFRILTGGGFPPPGGAGPDAGPGGAGPGGVGPGGPPPGPLPPTGPFIEKPKDPPLFPPDETPPRLPRLDPRLKKIYVYEEGVLEAGAASDERVVHVRTDAFDLSGFLDLTELRPGDEVTVELLVSVAGRPHRLFERTVFTDPGVRTLADIARGRNYVSARDVKIVLRQTASADDYATAIPVAYQFVVESR